MPTIQELVGSAPNRKLGTDNDTQLIQEGLDSIRLSPIRVFFPEIYNVEDSLRVTDKIIVWLGPGGIRTTSNYGTIADSDEKAQRTRSLFKFVGGGHVFKDGFQTFGPKPDGQISKSPQQKWEGQAVIDAFGTDLLQTCGSKFHSPWGDIVHLGWRSGPDNSRIPCRNNRFYGTLMYQPGRCGVVANAFEGIDWRGGMVVEPAASMLDVEPAYGSWNRDLRVTDVPLEGGRGFYAHLHGQSPLEDVYILGAARSGGPVSIECIGPNATERINRFGFDPGPVFKNMHFIGSSWDKPQSGGHVLRFYNADYVYYLNNSGPIRDTHRDEPEFVSVPNYKEENNKIWYVR